MPLLRLCLSAVLIAATLGKPVQAAEEILRFHSDIHVQPDSSMQVVETIRVRAEGGQIKRGIYRDFPTDYRDRLNNRIRVGFEVESVLRDGLSEPFSTQRQSNGVRVYIGNKNKRLAPGEYEYKIRYVTTRQLGYFNDHDELYWNVTGNGWGFAIKQASAAIKLPVGIAPGAIAVEGYTGPMGATAQNYTATVAANSEAYIETTADLQPGEGLTVVVSWPKEFVTEPSQAERAGYLLADNRSLLLVLAGLLTMAACLFIAWFRHGRDPEAGPVFPHYTAPSGLSPGACRYVQQMSHDNQCFTAAVLNLAVKGYVTIHEGYTAALREVTEDAPLTQALEHLAQLQEKLQEGGVLQRNLLSPMLEIATKAIESAGNDTFVLEKNAAIDGLERPGPGEKVLLDKLFQTDKYLVLTNKNHERMNIAINAHKESLKRFYQKANFLTNGIRVLPAMLLGVIFFVLSLRAGEPSPLVIVMMALSIPLVLVFINLLKAPTFHGRKVMDQLAGFQEYLTIAEADDLQGIQGISGPRPNMTPELFERYLPYAVALDVEQPWADQFENELSKASVQQDSSYRPVWYSSNKPINTFSGFTTGLTSSLDSAISSSSTAPGSSSGSGGGGSSGGGGGGGGGGGW